MTLHFTHHAQEMSSSLVMGEFETLSEAVRFASGVSYNMHTPRGLHPSTGVGYAVEVRKNGEWRMHI